MTIATGSELRSSVLAEMRKALKAGRISRRQYRKALKVRFPETVPDILGTSLKVEKSLKKGFLTSIVYLAPSRESVAYGGADVCPLASLGCSLACLATKGRLRMTSGAQAKAWKTLLWLYCPEAFKALLRREIYNLRNRAIHKGLTPAVRLNGASDIVWEAKFPQIFRWFPDVVFYDYSKISARVLSSSLPSNYSLTFSRSEANEPEAIKVLKAGRNVAIVFTDLAKAMREGWKGFRVINGDETDARPIDDVGVVVGLSPKGKAKDDSGFFVHN